LSEPRRIVRTVLGDVDASSLGLTYAHEHLAIDSTLVRAAYPHILLDDPAVAIEEVTACRGAGVQTMVDAMPAASGRNVLALARIARAAGVNVLATTGLHHDRYYGPGHWTARIDADELARLFIEDIATGIDAFDCSGPVVRRTDHRAGVIKVATGGPMITGRERHLFRSAAAAHHATGAPILTHCEQGHGALEQIAALTGLGVSVGAILVSHTDKVADPGYHDEIAASGAWLVYDQAVRRHEDPVASTTAVLAEHLAATGRLGQVLLGTDGARRDLWTAYGGRPGLAWLASSFPDALAARGLSRAQVRQLLVDNPVRAFALRAITA
jgi:predicted metal-dependent phosphotriesterase family hydrolase